MAFAKDRMTATLADVFRRWVLPFADPRHIASLALLPRFVSEATRFKRLAKGDTIPWGETYPCLLDRVSETPFDPHYFYQGAWLARRLSATKPTLHVDVGSSVTMVSILSAQVPVAFLDYRPLPVQLPGLHCVGGTGTQLPFADAAAESLSSLHVIEHIGLGRYGDPLDPQGSRRAAAELARVLRPGGRLFLSVPVGRERVCFNAHRVHTPRTIQSFVPDLRLESFSLVDDAGRYTERVSIEAAANLDYGCGLFEFVKGRG
jgi:SAM-dependent methyltransferase